MTWQLKKKNGVQLGAGERVCECAGYQNTDHFAVGIQNTEGTTCVSSLSG